VARRCTLLGARCTGIRRRPELGAPEGFARVAGPDALDRELAGADVLVLAAPDTPDTRRLMDARRLELLPAGAIVANVGRGSALDEGALAARLADGRLRGAVLDVFNEEPLPEASALWALTNVILTPHIAAVSPRRFWERELALFLDNWGRYQRGEPLRNVVDKRAGY
jgi:phosphoglycerate dehydrogenase-like enzyme